MAVRAWLETVIPPVFGKEMESSERADISNTGIGYFIAPHPYPPRRDCVVMGEKVKMSC
jgi:hypothetical protein